MTLNKEPIASSILTAHLTKGKMKAYSLLAPITFICFIYRYASFEIKPELRKFGFGINYKYEGMLSHSFNKSYVATKFILPTVKDLKFSTLTFNDKFEYLQENKAQHSEEKQYILDCITYVKI